MAPKSGNTGLLSDARVYLSGPMDFVASREEEKKHGWRHRLGDFLKAMDVTVFDPWFKPEVRGLHEYGREGETTTEQRKNWTFAQGRDGAQTRSALAEFFWPAMHIDLRMVDTSDFIVSYCPTNVYSVGTPHEIIVARQQRKPVLLVSPRVEFPALADLRKHLANDKKATELLQALTNQVPIKENPDGSPSLWYMPLIGGEHFFDGFGFAQFRDKFGWTEDIRIDDDESEQPPQKPLLPFLAQLNLELPKKWDRVKQDFVANDDWLLWDLKKDKKGADVSDACVKGKVA
ncbi:MAG: nucleoside 2-deoxyribosyltransferase domain-containing protein [Acidobacteriia bacterium]|nr:nucleoside 2-deoxyribosyltransferase domain-containing protein [Terriglobia bacterium]